MKKKVISTAQPFANIRPFIFKSEAFTRLQACRRPPINPVPIICSLTKVSRLLIFPEWRFLRHEGSTIILLHAYTTARDTARRRARKSAALFKDDPAVRGRGAYAAEIGRANIEHGKHLYGDPAGRRLPRDSMRTTAVMNAQESARRCRRDAAVRASPQELTPHWRRRC